MPLTESVNQGSQTVSANQPIASVAPTIPSASVASTPTKENRTESDEAKVCWIEVKRYPYQPDHQVELLHLQAEADALLIKLQAATSKD